MHYRWIACLAAALSFGGPAGGARAQETSGILSLTFDDAAQSQYHYGLPVMNRYKLIGTTYITTADVQEAVTEDWWTMSWEEIRAWKKAGWEIGAHTVTHPELPSLTDAALTTELEQPIDAIKAHTGVAVVSFASPFGITDERTISAIKMHYQNHVEAFGFGRIDEAFNPLGKTDPYHIGRAIVERDTPVEAVCQAIGEAARKRVWLVLGFHGIVPEPASDESGAFELSVAKLEKIARCAVQAQKNGSLRIATVKDALALASDHSLSASAASALQ